jgi:hypothetical protein
MYHLAAKRVAATLIFATALGVHAADDVGFAHANGEVGFRLGAEGIAVYYDSDRDTRGIHGFADKAPMGFGFMLSYWFPGSALSLDLDIAVQTFMASISSANGSGPPAGAVFRPGIRFSLPAVPLYLRAAIPINTHNVTMAHPSWFQHETFDLRTGVGVVLPLGPINPFLEANVDFPLGGGAGPSIFSAWTFAVDIGVDVRLGL